MFSVNVPGWIRPLYSDSFTRNTNAYSYLISPASCRIAATFFDDAPSGMSTLEMIEELCYVEPVKEVVDTLTIPEGYSIEQIAAKCEEQDICSSEEFRCSV